MIRRTQRAVTSRRTTFAIVVAVASLAAAVCAVDLSPAAVKAEGAPWQLFAAGSPAVPIPRGFAEAGFVVTNARATKQFQPWLLARDRRLIRRFNYRKHAVVAMFFVGMRGSRVILESIHRSEETLTVQVALVPAAKREQWILYRLYRLPKSYIGTPLPKRVTIRTRALLSPPSAYLETSSGTFRLNWGGGCWNRGDRASCATPPPPGPGRIGITDVPTRSGEIVTFRLGFDPVRVDVSIWFGETPQRHALPLTRVPRWRVPADPSGPIYISLNARSGFDPTGWGDAIYFARLVKP